MQISRGIIIDTPQEADLSETELTLIEELRVMHVYYTSQIEGFKKQAREFKKLLPKMKDEKNIHDFWEVLRNLMQIKIELELICTSLESIIGRKL